ncbi:AMP-dependent synthetase/ligase [Leisingera sp. D0M16]|uniref:AMP-dependent synthetase/ligase n=1 Tax=Leisingera coralii TaxID=3351347 RepID=UPI003B9F6A50
MTARQPELDVISFDPVRTLPEVFFQRVARNPGAVAYSEFRENQWADFTWQQVAHKAGLIRAALDRAGMEPGERVGILLQNGVDWVAFDIAAMANGLITVPIYLHDSAENNGYILAHSGVRLCIMDTRERWQSLAAQCADCSKLEVIWIQQVPVGPVHNGRQRIEVLDDVLPDEGAAEDDIRCSAEDVATIIHTSGTTGLPKGVMLSHRAMLWNADAVTKFIPPLTTDVFLSVLPLAHSFERTMGYYLPLVSGARVAFSRSIQTLREDIAVIRPTILIAVPRLYERIYEAILEKAGSSPITKALTMFAADTGWRLFQAKHGRAAAPSWLTRALFWPVLRRLVAKKIMMAFGGRLRVAVSGGAPLSEEASHFLIGLGLPLIEGYGLTETAPVVTATTIEDSLPGSVGSALQGVELKTTDEGELLIRTPSLMLGYWDDPEKTEQAIDPEGWFRTGDIAEFHEGHVFIRSRLKEIIALSTGKKVAPTKVEASIEQKPLFEQALVTGDGKPCLAAIVVLNGEAWAALARDLGVAEDDLNAPAAAKAILSEIARATQELPSYARVRAVHSVLEPWTTGNGLLTPTLKAKRPAIEQRFSDEIEAMFGDLKAKRTELELHAGH